MLSLLMISHLLFAAHVSLFTVSLAGDDSIEPSDVIIVLGSTVELTGEPSRRLQSRLDKGLALYEAGVAPRMIVSGGFGKEGFEEAVVMKRYLIDRGVPEGAILEDRNGSNTRESAFHSRAQMLAHGWRKAVLVSQYYHLPRLRLAFEYMGVNDPQTVSADFFWSARDLYAILREVIAYVAYLHPYEGLEPECGEVN